MWIDAHHHLWQYNARDYGWMSDEMQPLRHDFLAPELESVLDGSGVSGSVVVQARQSVEETEWLLQLAGQCSLIRGVVGWVPLTDDGIGECLDRLCENRRLRGVRHVLHDEPDDDYMLREDFNRGVDKLASRGLSYDILVFERHLPQTIEFVDLHPNQIFVLDHIAKPRIREGILSPWRENIRKLARRPNVCCKLSGMVTEANWAEWKQGELTPYFDTVLAAFGPSRLMFGSDWPVVTLAASYQRWMSTVRQLLSGLSSDEQEMIGSGTATAAYRL